MRLLVNSPEILESCFSLLMLVMKLCAFKIPSIDVTWTIAV
jgi:hypothetical protein